MVSTQYFKYRRVILLIISIAFAFGYQNAIAVTFTDGFETGDLSKSDNDFKWAGMGTNPIVVTSFAEDGNASFRLKFPGTASGDAWVEQRFNLSGNHNEVWLKADIFIPSNYYCRGGDHNKGPFYIWSGTYGAGAANVAAKFEHWCRGGNAYLTFNPGADGWDYGHIPTTPGGLWDDSKDPYKQGQMFVDLARDLNKWHEWIVHIRPATTPTSNDGLVEVWKNGRKIWALYDLKFHSKVANYFDQGYIMGYANSGFDEDTLIYYDNFVFSTEKITAISAPKPPNSVESTVKAK